MIKTLGFKDGRPLLLIGLSRSNCELLLEGKPIVIDLRMMKLEADNPQQYDFNHLTLAICAGETERCIIEELKIHISLPKKLMTHDEEN